MPLVDIFAPIVFIVFGIVFGVIMLKAIVFYIFGVFGDRPLYPAYYSRDDQKRKNDESIQDVDQLEKPKRKPVSFKLGDDGEMIPADDSELSIDDLLHIQNHEQ